jgi:hypothetical protein
LTRVVYSSLYNGLVRVLFGVRVRDVNFAFKVCRASVFNNIVLKSEGSFIDAELIVRAKNLGIQLCSLGSITFRALAVFRHSHRHRSL